MHLKKNFNIKKRQKKLSTRGKKQPLTTLTFEEYDNKKIESRITKKEIKLNPSESNRIRLSSISGTRNLLQGLTVTVFPAIFHLFIYFLHGAIFLLLLLFKCNRRIV